MHRVLTNGCFIAPFFNPKHARFMHVVELLDLVDLDEDSSLRMDNSLLYWAIFWRNAYVVEALLGLGASPNRTTLGHGELGRHVHPVWQAVIHGDRHVLDILLRHVDVDVRDVRLEVAIRCKHAVMRPFLNHETIDIHKLSTRIHDNV